MPYTYEYPMFGYTADAIVIAPDGDKYKVLLIQRKHEPYKDHWAFPGGFVDQDEVADQAVLRELKEETGLEVAHMSRLDVFDKVGRDPRGRTVTVAYTCILDQPATATALDDAADARWFDIHTLPPLAFDHDEMMAMAIARLGL